MIKSLLIQPDELTKTWIDRMANAGVSVLGIHPVGGKKAAQSLEELLEYWFDLSPAISGAILNCACFLLGWRILGKAFIGYSIFAAAGFSLGYGFFEQFPQLWPELVSYPLLAALLGALFIGIGAGLCVRAGGATVGDDALAMSLSHRLKLPIQSIYLVTDLTVLALSLTYIPVKRILYSLLTVILSGQIIGLIQCLPAKPSPVKNDTP